VKGIPETKIKKSLVLTSLDSPLSRENPQNGIEPLIHDLLLRVGEDPEREGLKRTPNRVARMYDELLQGYHVNLDELVNNAVFDTDYQEMVLVSNIRFYSLCEHHLLPFYGYAHVAYIPDKKIIGLSKIPRIVEMYARRLQVQEQMTQQIADTLEAVLHPKGIAVFVEGAHMCAMMRGVKKEDTRMKTTATKGLFREDINLFQKFIAQLSVSQKGADFLEF